MEKITISTEYIRLDQFLKFAGVCGSGAEAKAWISEGKAKVNGATEQQRGKKIRKGDIVEIIGKEYLIDISQDRG